MIFKGQHPEYIGDGVYASFDGYQIWVQAERYGMVHSVALEPAVIASLLAYRDRIAAMFDQEKTDVG